MERVAVLINKLQEQLKQQTEVKNMLMTAQMLQAELLQKLQKQNGHTLSKVSVVMPFNITSHSFDSAEKEVFELQADNITEAHINNSSEEQQEILPEPELVNPQVNEPVTEEQSFKSKINNFKRNEPSGWLFDPNEVPTLAHQDKVVYELNDTILSEGGSVNDSLKEERPEVSTIMQDTPIRDLKKAISINERHNFIHDLFRGDETMYERSIKTINGFNIFAEAEYWIQRELKLKLGWDVSNQTVKSFDQLVKRRFS